MAERLSSMISESLPEALVEPVKRARQLAPDHFAAQAEDIFQTIGDAVRRGEGLRAGYALAEQVYVKEETDPSLKEFAEVLLSAPRLAALQKRLDQTRETIEAQGTTPELKKRLRAQIDKALEYNHRVRNLVVENPSQFRRAELTDWLSEASRGNERWAARQVAGIAGEIAISRRLERLPWVRSVVFGSHREDLQGTDLIVELQDGSWRNVDVKVGRNGSRSDYRRNGTIVARFPSECFKGYGVAPEYREQVSQSLEMLLRSPSHYH